MMTKSTRYAAVLLILSSLTAGDGKSQLPQPPSPTPRPGANTLPAPKQTPRPGTDIRPAPSPAPPPGANVAASPALDEDMDNIPDNEEKRLLEAYRPYYRFSLDRGRQDEYRPADALWYIRHSELLASGDENDSPLFSNAALVARPELVLMDVGKADWVPPKGPSDITQRAAKSDYHINPIGDVGRRGSDWATVLSQRNVGLYGHVVPIKLDGADSYDREAAPGGSGAGQTYYKIEYWQFFGFNEANAGPAGQHEGDWITVQLLYNPRTDRPECVLFYEHGNIENRRKITGGGYAITLRDGSGNTLPDCENAWEYLDSDKAARFCQDQVTRKFTHPVVYIEWGAHEPWPTEKGFFAGAPNHNGDGYSFLTATPPNLGEVEHPLTETGAARIILRFNGYWGARGGPPPGPGLHYQWTYPADSSIRWQLKGLEN